MADDRFPEVAGAFRAPSGATGTPGDMDSGTWIAPGSDRQQVENGVQTPSPSPLAVAFPRSVRSHWHSWERSPACTRRRPNPIAVAAPRALPGGPGDRRRDRAPLRSCSQAGTSKDRFQRSYALRTSAEISKLCWRVSPWSCALAYPNQRRLMARWIGAAAAALFVRTAPSAQLVRAR